MKHPRSALVGTLGAPLCLLLAGCGGSATPAAPTATPTPRATSTPKATNTPVATATPANTATPADTATPVPLNNSQLGQKLAPATVRIVANFGGNQIQPESGGSGSGFVIDRLNGYIVTNNHVVEGASQVAVILPDKTQAPAHVVARSECDDLAVVQTTNTNGLANAVMGRSDAMQLGDDVVALGYPLPSYGADLSLNPGTISQLHTQLGNYNSLIKIDAAINHGNSGGPLVNRLGQVVGINTLGLTGAENTNYSIAMSYAKPVIEQLLKGKNLHYIGLNLVPNDPQYKKIYGTALGMIVVGVDTGSPGDQLGVQPGDLLLSIEGSETDDMGTVCGILSSHTDGNVLKLKLLRPTTGQTMEGELTIGKIGAANPGATGLQVIGTPTPLPSATPVPAQNTPTTPPARDTPTAAAGQDTPTPSTSAWTTVDDTKFANGAGTYALSNGSTLSKGLYSVTVKAGYQTIRSPKAAVNLGNGSVGVSMAIRGDGVAGVSARWQASSSNKWTMYACWIAASGTFGCGSDVGDSWTYLAKAKASSAIKPADFNILQLTVVGNVLRFSINQKDVFDYTDSAATAPTQGSWGAYVSAANDKPTTAYYSEILIQQKQ